MTLRLGALAFLLLAQPALAADTAPASPPAEAATPAWTSAVHERGGWSLQIVKIERRASVAMSEVMTARQSPGETDSPKKQRNVARRKSIIESATISPREGLEYFAITLEAKPTSPTAADLTLENIQATDTSGARFDCMVTRLTLEGDDRNALLPVPVPTGATITSFAIGDLVWSLEGAPSAAGAAAPIGAKAK